jgi:prepilin-type N-terminal cleavage/methylation domain-containing protein
MSQRGVSLIELIIVVVALAAGIALLGTGYLQAARTVATNEDIQVAWQVAQACADHALGRVRRPGAFANVATGSNPCGSLPTNGTTVCPGKTFYAEVNDLAVGTEPCTGAGWICRQVDVCVARGGYTATLTFALIEN